MDSGKQQQEQEEGGSETSSEENEGSTERVKHRRCYECAFCKRGFTNAQALGGHMNIHRKDRATKAKHQTPYVHHNQHHSSHHHAPFSTQSSTTYLPVMEYTQPRISNHHMYLSGSASNSFYSIDGGPHSFVASNSTSTVSHTAAALTMNPELVGANLSLRINLDGDNESRSGSRVRNCDEVDLELRLGHG